MKRLIIPVLLAAAAAAGWAEVRVTHAISMHGEPKYSADFEHFDYVNPDAPQGGTLHMHSIGTYDNFNRYAQRGVSAIASTSLYDTLMTRSEDETNVLYPLIAEKL
jgi:microcin C transport system substrate-binding protein